MGFFDGRYFFSGASQTNQYKNVTKGRLNIFREFRIEKTTLTDYYAFDHHSLEEKGTWLDCNKS